MTAPEGRRGPERPDDEHRDWDELAVGWALHALEPEDETQFTGHLTGCARCARTVAETAEVMASMAGELPEAEPSEELRERLRAAVEETEQLPPIPRPDERPAVPPAVPRPQPVRRATGSEFGNLRAPLPVHAVAPRPAWRRVLPTALVAAAVAAVLSLGAWNVIVTGDRDAARAAVTEQARMLDALLAPGRAALAPVTTDGHTVATVVAREDQIQVVASGLSVNDSHDHTYVVWGMGEDMPQALGTFDVVTPQMDLRTVSSTAAGLDDYSAYAISIEPGRKSPSFPTKIVGQGEVTS